LRGKIWIVDFIYTQCTDTCPLQTAEMAKLQDLSVNDRDLRLYRFRWTRKRTRRKFSRVMRRVFTPITNGGCF
jgi:hypothetical protein